MTPQVVVDYQALSRYAADWLIGRLRQRPEALVCLATGATPQGTYSLLAEHGAAEPELVERMQVIKLDEWGGLARDDPASCEQYLRRALIEPLRLKDRYVSFDSDAADPQAECARIARWLAEHGPIDTCVLGLGVNGHLGFNEPAASLQPHAHVAQLSSASLTHAMLDCAQKRPAFGLTLGMADILQARQALLLVSGSTKREPLRRLLSGQIATDFPASLLWLHRDVSLVCDAEAA
ncbi:MAG: galactosamine-6-phosphate isomerase [Pirellulales bacterium]